MDSFAFGMTKSMVRRARLTLTQNSNRFDVFEMMANTNVFSNITGVRYFRFRNYLYVCSKLNMDISSDQNETKESLREKNPKSI